MIVQLRFSTSCFFSLQGGCSNNFLLGFGRPPTIRTSPPPKGLIKQRGLQSLWLKQLCVINPSLKRLSRLSHSLGPQRWFNLCCAAILLPLLFRHTSADVSSDPLVRTISNSESCLISNTRTSHRANLLLTWSD